MDPINNNSNNSPSEFNSDTGLSSSGTTFNFVVNCSVDSLSSTPKLNPNNTTVGQTNKSQTQWTPSSINKNHYPPLPPKTFLSMPDNNNNNNTETKEEQKKENTHNSSSNESNTIDSNHSTPQLLKDSKDSNSSGNKDTVIIGGSDEFVIINSEIDTGLRMYDTYGFLIEQDQIQLFLIYKDKIVLHDQEKKDNWINFFEKNPQALHSLFLSAPQSAHLVASNNSNNTTTSLTTSPIHVISNLTFSITNTNHSNNNSNNNNNNSNNNNNNNNNNSNNHYINENNNSKIYRQRTPKIFKDLIRSGIPNEYRSMIWLRTSGAFTRLLEAPDEYYEILDKYKNQESIATKQIAMDVERTFPDHKYLNTKEKMDSLSNVLIAYSWRNPSVGYCQCMNFIAGFLLIYMSEHEAYWLLVSIIEDLLPTEYFTSTMIDSSVDVRFVFDDLLQKKLPRLHQHLLGLNLTLPLIITQWFLCIMATTTPTETTFRIWDCFFSEGSKVLFRVALAFFKLNEEKLLTCRDYTTLYNLIKKIPNGMYDSDHLLDAAFNGLGSFPMKNLIKKRKDSKVVVVSEYNEFQKMKNSPRTRSTKQQ